MTNELLQATTEFTAALLVAILPAVEEFAAKVGVETPRPLRTNHVERFVPHPVPGHFGGVVVLPGPAKYLYQSGRIVSYEGTNHYTTRQTPSNAARLQGPVRLTAPAAVTYARTGLATLDASPDEAFVLPEPLVDGPFEEYGLTIPRFLIRWIDPRDGARRIEIEINATRPRVERLFLAGQEFNRPPPLLAGELGRQQAGQLRASRRRAEALAVTAENLAPFHQLARHWGRQLGAGISALDSNSVARLIHTPSLTTLDLWLKPGERWRINQRTGLCGYFRSGSFFPEETTNSVSRYLGRTRITPAQAERVARETLARLGFRPPSLGLDKPPRILRPTLTGDAQIPRLDFAWDRGQDGVLEEFGAVEVDTATGEWTSVRVLHPGNRAARLNEPQP